MVWQETVLRLGTALVLGALIGFERQWRQRVAGLRTNTLVALGAACFIVFSQSTSNAEAQPLQVAAQIVSGIGFLGGGIIFREGLTVRGLNTAATLWGSAAVGMFAGGGLLLEAAIATAFIELTNLGLRPLVRLINQQPQTSSEIEVQYFVSVTCRAQDEAMVRALLLQGINSGGLGLKRLDSTDIDGTGCVSVSAELLLAGRKDAALEQIVGRLSLEASVTAARWEVANAIG